ncbi:hypothetical protein GGR58DRAFT_471323 [Xylaria digitata]|nr:hypothetical protein GGR58DRAFT_471323 [Xylaria digitata]
MRRDQVVKEHDFVISSADGERIIGLDVSYFCNGALLGFKVCPCHEPVMVLATQTNPRSIKVHTNLNRTAQFPPCHTSGICRSNWKSVRLWPETGHASRELR